MNVRVFVIMLFCLKCSTGWVFSQTVQPPTIREKVLNFFYAIFAFINNSCYEMVINHFVSFATVLATGVILVLLILVIKRRPSTLKKSFHSTETSTGSISANFYVAGSSNSDQPVRNFDRGFGNFIKPPNEFVGKSDISLWFMKLESYLKSNIPPHLWLETTISLINESCLKRIPSNETLCLGEDGYIKLKKSMLDLYSNREKISELNLYDLTTRTQKINENVQEYGSAIKNMAAEIFKAIPSSSVSTQLKAQLARGIRDPTLRARAIEKLHKKSSETMTFDEFVAYMRGKELGRDESLKLSSTDSEDPNQRKHNPAQNRPNLKSHHSYNLRSTSHYNNDNIGIQSYQNRGPTPNPNSILKPQNQEPNFSANKVSFNPAVQQSSINSVSDVENYIEMRGIALFDGAPIQYLCDSGAAKTIISENAYKRILQRNPGKYIKRYIGRGLYSANSRLKIMGVIKINQIKMSSEQLVSNLDAIVVKDLQGNECLLGRNWLRHIPNLNKSFDSMSGTIRAMTMSLAEKSPTSSNEREKRIAYIETGTDTPDSSELESSPVKCTLKHPTISENPNSDSEMSQIEQYRGELQNFLACCSATKFEDLNPLANRDDAFKISLMDPRQKPIFCKSRPLPHQLKQKVKDLLDEQEQAGLFRKSNSAWASALRVVHKPDGSIRLTVDYKPLNKCILVEQYPLPSVADLYTKLSHAKY